MKVTNTKAESARRMLGWALLLSASLAGCGGDDTSTGPLSSDEYYDVWVENDGGEGSIQAVVNVTYHYPDGVEMQSQTLNFFGRGYGPESEPGAIGANVSVTLLSESSVVVDILRGSDDTGLSVVSSNSGSGANTVIEVRHGNTGN